jgi:hypothetical protein
MVAPPWENMSNAWRLVIYLLWTVVTPTSNNVAMKYGPEIQSA